jgi:hypothetical protein
MPGTDRLSASQDQLLTSIQQLQAAQRENMNEYASAQTNDARTRIMSTMKKNEALRANLLASASDVNLVQTKILATLTKENANIVKIVEFAQDQLKTQLEQLEALQESHDGKKRMIEINTYYGKRFMAQAGVMKIFIYMCIPVLILAILANAGLFPSYIAGFMIVAIVVVGVVYIYAAVHDINRRDNRNFDEYTWEFDPSRVGTIVNPNYGTTGTGTSGPRNVVGCFNGNCCGPSTKWDGGTGTCITIPSSTTAPPTASTTAPTTRGTSSLPGDLNN